MPSGCGLVVSWGANLWFQSPLDVVQKEYVFRELFCGVLSLFLSLTGLESQKLVSMVALSLTLCMKFKSSL